MMQSMSNFNANDSSIIERQDFNRSPKPFENQSPVPNQSFQQQQQQQLQTLSHNSNHSSQALHSQINSNQFLFNKDQVLESQIQEFLVSIHDHHQNLRFD
ncbi:hypothetical protein SSS_06043 [Sarcoptes scabiei]|nr:hypothetical protein SSS_06043 [Sarcoptes scabiei]